jgi:steroid 5-alpha reductase family enzyme
VRAMQGWVVGFTIEAVADQQKESWRARPENKTKSTWITEGLWSTCRHPNYFGEVCIRVGNAAASRFVVRMMMMMIWCQLIWRGAHLL